jgi:hypothetical protein
LLPASRSTCCPSCCSRCWQLSCTAAKRLSTSPLSTAATDSRVLATRDSRRAEIPEGQQLAAGGTAGSIHFAGHLLHHCTSSSMRSNSAGLHTACRNTAIQQRIFCGTLDTLCLRNHSIRDCCPCHACYFCSDSQTL